MMKSFKSLFSSSSKTKKSRSPSREVTKIKTITKEEKEERERIRKQLEKNYELLDAQRRAKSGHLPNTPQVSENNLRILREHRLKEKAERSRKSKNKKGGTRKKSSKCHKKSVGKRIKI
jgi:hypothetical protein